MGALMALGGPLGQARRLAAMAQCCLLAGGGLVAGALILRVCFPLSPVLGPLSEPSLALGLILILASIFPAARAGARTAMGLGTSLLAVLILVGIGEGVFRWLEYDFRGQEAAWQRVPPYYREPRTPVGDTAFRRRGPEEWTGQVIRTWLKETGSPLADGYRTEPSITVRYDHQGFRNEIPMEDWEVAVAGDSFTELGSIPYDQLFTTLLARRTGKPVRNLGVSATGPLTHLTYLQEFGVAPSLEQVVVVFFGGNDAEDLQLEHRALRRFWSTGQRDYRPFRRQTSFVSAAEELIFGRPMTRKRPAPPVRMFRSRQGAVPVTVTQVAPAVAELGREFHTALGWFLDQYRAFGLRHAVRPWVAYMPCKGRVLYRRLRIPPGLRSPGGLPPASRSLPRLLAEGCRDRGIGFIDLAPALVEAAAERGELVYNPLVDTHLNARGAAVVARELARHLDRSEP